MSLNLIALIAAVVGLIGVLSLQYLASNTAQELLSFTLFLAGAWTVTAVDAARVDWPWMVADAVLFAGVTWVLGRRVLREAPHVEE